MHGGEIHMSPYCPQISQTGGEEVCSPVIPKDTKRIHTKLGFNNERIRKKATKKEKVLIVMVLVQPNASKNWDPIPTLSANT